MARILVIGGAGFIGSNVVARMIREHHEVFVVDNLSRGSEKNLPRFRNLFRSMKELLWMYEGYIKFDYIYDFAARVFGVRDLYRKPASDLTYNLRVVSENIEAAPKLLSEEGIYLLASSSCIYDFPDVIIPHHEEDDEEVPDTGYGLSKRVAEELLMYASQEFDFDYRIARLFNVYGVGENLLNSPHVIPDFIRQAYELREGDRETFNIIGSGKQTRSFLHIRDAVEGLWGKLPLDTELTTYNLGSPEEIEIQALAYSILELMGIKPGSVTLVHDEAPTQDIQRRSADIDRARKLLDWEPKVKLKDGLEEVIAWMIPKLEDEKKISGKPL